VSVINERSVTIGTDIIFSLGSHTNTIGDVMIRGRSWLSQDIALCWRSQWHSVVLTRTRESSDKSSWQSRDILLSYYMLRPNATENICNYQIASMYSVFAASSRHYAAANRHRAGRKHAHLHRFIVIWCGTNTGLLCSSKPVSPESCWHPIWLCCVCVAANTSSE